MLGGNSAAWAQALISGVAIIASGLIAVFVPWNERRLARKREEGSRLDVEVTRSSSGGLELLVSYMPEFHSHALGVSVALIDPADARVYKGVFVERDGSRVRERSPTGLAQNVRYNAVALLRIGDDASRLHQGVMYIEWPDERRGPHQAVIDVTVLEHGNRLVLRRRMRVSPINDSYYENGAPAAVLVGKRD